MRIKYLKLLLFAFFLLAIGILLRIQLSVKYIPHKPHDRYEPTKRVWECHDQELDQILKKMGCPTQLSEISLDDARVEFRCELLNWYPAESLGNRLFVQFLEATWVYDGHSVTLWFHKVKGRWICLTSMWYPSDVRF